MRGEFSSLSYTPIFEHLDFDIFYQEYVLGEYILNLNVLNIPLKNPLYLNYTE